MEEKKVFPVFCVDICFQSYAMDLILVGAESEDDLIKNLRHILSECYLDNDLDSDRFIEEIIESDYRIQKKANLYTDKPYEILDRVVFIE